jgi:predicted porin
MPRILTRGNFDSTGKNISETTLTLKELQKMQKKILVLAIAAAISAPAFADTTVYGLVDAAVVSAGGSGLQNNVQAVSGGLAGSRLGVKATEKLDNGLTAVAVIEFALDSETSDTVGSARQKMLALAGDFGTVATGYLQTAGYDWGNKYDVVGGSSITPLGNIQAGQGFYLGSSGTAKRAQRALAYISPNMGGLVVAANYSTAFASTGNLGYASATADTQINASLLSADYTKDAFSIGAVYLATNVAATAASNVTEYSLGAAYNFGVVAVKGTYQDQVKNTAGASHDTVTSIGATLPVGSGTVAASYAISTIGTNANTNASGFTVAYLQGLSKTTTAYVAYNAMAQDTSTKAVSVLNSVAPMTSGIATGASTSVVAVGLSKKF